jgi:hypothetical protein
VQQAEQIGAAGARRHRGGLAATYDDRTDAVPRARGEKADGRDRGDGKVALLALGGAEVEARRQVAEHPRLEFPIGDGVAHVRRLHTGGDVPVHAPDVVSRLVLARFARFGPVRGHEAAVIALQQAVEPARDSEVEAAKHLV